MEYYQNRDGKECVACSLANVLLEIGDQAMAEQVYHTSHNHPLFSKENGVSLILVPQFIQEITNGQYSAKNFLYYEYPKEIIEGELDRTYGENAEYAKRTFKQLLDQNKIICRESGTPIYQPPGFLLIEFPVYVFGVVTSYVSHCIAHISDKVFINDGQPTTSDELGEYIFSVLGYTVILRRC